MFGRRKPTSENPEVQEALAVRDELLDAVGDAVAIAGWLQNDLMAEYEEAEKQRETRSWRSPRF